MGDAKAGKDESQEYEMLKTYMGRTMALAMFGVAALACGEADQDEPATRGALERTIWADEADVTLRPLADGSGITGGAVQLEGADGIIWGVFVEDSGHGAALASALRQGPVTVTLRGDTVAGLMGFAADGTPKTYSRDEGITSMLRADSTRTLCGWYKLEGDGQLDFQGQSIQVLHRIGPQGSEPFALEPEHECGWTVSGTPTCNVGYGCEWGFGPGGPPPTYGVCDGRWHDGWTRNVCYCNSEP